MFAGVFAHGWIGTAGVDMGDLLPQMLGCSAYGVLIGGMFGDVIPVVGSTLFAEQLLKPLVAQHKHWIGIDHEACRFCGHAPLLQGFCAQQMQIVFFPIPSKDLVLVHWANKLPAFRSPVATGLLGWMLIN